MKKAGESADRTIFTCGSKADIPFFFFLFFFFEKEEYNTDTDYPQVTFPMAGFCYLTEGKVGIS